MQVTRQSLLERLKQDEQHVAWEEFYAMYWAVVIRYAQKLGLDETSAHDVLQETMLVLIRKLPGFTYDPAKGKFRNFLLTIVHRKTLASIHRVQSKQEQSMDTPLTDEGVTLTDFLADKSNVLPHEQMEQNWQDSIREEALRKIQQDPTVEERTFDIFIAYVVEGQPAQEISKRYDINNNAVYQIKNRIIKRLKIEVEKMVSELEG